MDNKHSSVDLTNARTAHQKDVPGESPTQFAKDVEREIQRQLALLGVDTDAPDASARLQHLKAMFGSAPEGDYGARVIAAAQTHIAEKAGAIIEE